MPIVTLAGRRRRDCCPTPAGCLARFCLLELVRLRKVDMPSTSFFQMTRRPYGHNGC